MISHRERDRAAHWWMSYMLPNEHGVKFKGRVGRRARNRGAPAGWLADGRPDPAASAWVVRGLTEEQWKELGIPDQREPTLADHLERNLKNSGLHYARDSEGRFVLTAEELDNILSAAGTSY